MRTLILIVMLAGFASADDDKAKRDRTAKAAMALAGAAENPPVVVADPGPQIMVGACIGDKCVITDRLDPNATDKEIKTAWERAAVKARALVQTGMYEDGIGGEFFEDVKPFVVPVKPKECLCNPCTCNPCRCVAAKYEDIYLKILQTVNSTRPVTVAAGVKDKADLTCDAIPTEPAGVYVFFLEDGKVKYREHGEYQRLMAPAVAKPAVVQPAPHVVNTWTDPNGCKFQQMSDGTTFSFCPNRK